MKKKKFLDGKIFIFLIYILFIQQWDETLFQIRFYKNALFNKDKPLKWINRLK